MASSVSACPTCGTKNRVPVSAPGRPRCGTCKADLPWLVEADDSDVEAAIATKLLVVLDLWAPWCGPCRSIAPVLEALSRDLAGKIKVVKVNVDSAPVTANRYQAQSIPLVLLIDDGRVVDSIVGAQPPPVLRNRITGALATR